jgi:diguanylate cyclase (GGDEF)-like protein/PAS domain S-box-containing protein
MRRLSAPALIGIVLLAAAATVGVGWFAHAPALVRFMTGVAMVLNTALCFSLLALALLSEGREPGRRRWLQTGLGVAVTLIAGLVLVQDVFAFDLGIDCRALHAWYQDDNTRPGRMSPATAFGFVLSGATLLLMQRVRGLWSGVLVQVLTAMIVIVGAVGIVSALLKLPLVYENYPFRQMALATAAGFILAGAALAACWRRHAWYLTRNLIENEARRIGLNSAVVLASIVGVSMLAGLVMMQRQVEALARDTLLWPLESRISLFRINVDQRAARAAMVGTRPELEALLRRLNERPADQDALRYLRDRAETFLPSGFIGLAFLSIEGREWFRVGRLSERPALAIPLRTTPHANTLMWSDESFVLQTRIRMLWGGEPVGVMVAEQRLTALGAALERSDDFAATGAVDVCGRQQGRLACFPQRHAPEAFTLPHDPALPVARALENHTGVTIMRDARLKNVIAAHGPIGSPGLGMAIQMDTTELYAPLREALSFVLLLALLLVAGGALLLYWHVTPLVNKLYLGDQRLRLALDSSRSAWWDWDLSTGTLKLSEHWQAMLGEPPGATVTTIEELQQLVHPEDLPVIKLKLQIALKSRETHYDAEHRVRRPDGNWMWISSIGRVVERDADEQALRMIGINADINQRKESALRIEHQARHDALTGLPNRVTFYDRLAHAMSRAQRGKTLMAVMYLDIDRFKSINDSLGHAAGDLLLKDFAQRLAYCVRAMDSAARMGGDEFAVVLEDLKHRDDGCHVALKIVREMQPEFPLEHHTIEITSSVGIAFYDGKEEISADQLVRNADAALYEAKNKGRNAYHVAA